MRVISSKLVVAEEVFARHGNEPAQRFIADEAGHIVKEILLNGGIAKGSPIYIDVPKVEPDPRDLTVGLTLEVKYFPPMNPTPDQRAIGQQQKAITEEP